LGFHPSNLSQALFDSSANITAFKYRGVQVEITRPSDELGTVITPTSIANNTNGDFTISSQGTSKIQLTDTRLLERLDFGYDENLPSLSGNPPFQVVNPGSFLSLNITASLFALSGNYRLTANKNVIRLGKDPLNLNSSFLTEFTIDNITNADLGTVIYLVVGENNPTYKITCNYPTPGSSQDQQNLSGIPIVDRTYSNKTITLTPNTIIKLTLVNRYFYYAFPFFPISWRYWYMENLEGEFNTRVTALETIPSWVSLAPFFGTGVSAGAVAPQVMKNQWGQVFFRGNISVANTTLTALSLPPEYRPAVEHRFSISEVGGTAPARAIVSAFGPVFIAASPTSGTSSNAFLNQITFFT
jgi:hypothetical protein